MAAQMYLIPTPEAPAALPAVRPDHLQPIGQALSPDKSTAAGKPLVRHSLVEYLSDIEAIQTTLESLDDEALDAGARQELEAMLLAAIAGTREKTDRTNGVLTAFATAVAAGKAEGARIAKRVASFERQAERLEKYVLATMTASGLKKLEGNTSTLTARPNPGAVVIDDENAIPVDYLRFPEDPGPPPPVPDKKAIAAALKADPASVPGCRIVPSSRLVRS